MIRLSAFVIFAVCFSFAVEAQESLKLGDFTSGLDGWGFQSKNAEGSLGYDAKRKIAILDAAFINRKPDSYAGMSKAFAVPLEIKELRIKFTTGNIRRAILKITDATGQTFQQAFEVKGSETGATAIISEGNLHPHISGIELGIMEEDLINSKLNPYGTLLVESIKVKIKSE